MISALRFLRWIGLLFVTALAFSQSPVSISIDTKAPGKVISPEFSGLSFETADVLPDNNGNYKFRASNSSLIRLFKTLGIKSLRIGGNTSDRPTVKVPGTADIDNLFAFAHAAGVRVIYTVRLRESKPEDVIGIAKYLVEHYKSDIDCLLIGNEPNIYFKTYPDYRDEIKKYMDAITALPNASDIKFCGPSTTPGKPEWSRGFAEDFGPAGRVRWITQHAYPGGSGRKVEDVAAGRNQILSPEFQQSYEHFYQLFAPAVMADKLAYRIEETNNFYNGGAKDVSDTFASALWGLDYLYWWASHDAQGINFHTGDNVAAGEQQTPCRYALFWSSPNGYSVHPLGYAVKAFDLGSHGTLLPVNFKSNKDAVNLTAYAVLAPDKTLYLTLINKDHGAAAHSASVSIAPGGPYIHGSAIFLAAPENDVSVTAGVTLGGAIKDDGTWEESWKPLQKPQKKSQFTLNLPPATAAVLRLAIR